MGHYVTNCHEEGQEIVIRQYYVQSLDQKVDPYTYEGIIAKRHFKERNKKELQEQSKEKVMASSEETNQPAESSSEPNEDRTKNIKEEPPKKKSNEQKKRKSKKEKSMEEIQKEQGRNKRRQIKRLRGILNENFTSNALSVVLTFSPEALSNGIIQNELKNEVAKFFRRIRKRIDNPFKYVYIISTQDITYSTGEINEAHPHVHMIIEGKDFELNGEDISIHTQKGIDISLQDAWGNGLVKAKRVAAAIDKIHSSQLDIDEIHFIKANATPADFESEAKYLIDQSIASFGMEGRMWDTSIGLAKPDKGFTVNDKYDSYIKIPEGLQLQSETEYGAIYKYKEKRYYKTKPGISINSIKKANPRFQ